MALNTILPKATFFSSLALFVSACTVNGDPTDPQSEIPPPSSPGIVITSPTANFVIGEALDMGATPGTQAHKITGWVRVEDNNGNDNTPSVLVNQQVATPHPTAAD